jgi:hypothetical protein
MRNRRRQHGKFLSHALHTSPGLESFGAEPTSSQIIVSSSFRTRYLVKDFAADVLDLLDGARTPVVWILHRPSSNTSERKPITAIEVIKQLVHQILQKNHTMLNERSLGLSAVRFQSARTEGEWFALLGSVLAGFKQIYIVVDTAILGKIEEERVASAWMGRFRELFAELRNRATYTVVKVLFVNYKPTFTQELGVEYQGSIVRVSEKMIERSIGDRKFKKRRKRAQRSFFASEGQMLDDSILQNQEV